jgi:hypothetical protein
VGQLIRGWNIWHNQGRRRCQGSRHPPARPALDRRRERLLASALSAPEGTPKRLLLPPRATDDSSRHRIPKWFAGASDNNQLIKEGRQVETSSPRVRLKTPWSKAKARAGTGGQLEHTCHAWTDGSYREAAGLGWLITEDQKGEGPDIAQGTRNLGGQQTAFDAELSAIEQAVRWFLAQGRNLPYQHMVVHSDSTSAIARASHTGAGPGQTTARNVRNLVCEIRGQGKNRRPRMGQGTPGHTWQREGGFSRRKSRQQDRTLQGHVDRPPQTPDLGKVQHQEGGVA